MPGSQFFKLTVASFWLYSSNPIQMELFSVFWNRGDAPPPHLLKSKNISKNILQRNLGGS